MNKTQLAEKIFVAMFTHATLTAEEKRSTAPSEVLIATFAETSFRVANIFAKVASGKEAQSLPAEKKQWQASDVAMTKNWGKVKLTELYKTDQKGSVIWLCIDRLGGGVFVKESNLMPVKGTATPDEEDAVPAPVKEDAVPAPKSKTTREWFEQCGEHWAKLALANTDEIILGAQRKSLSEALRGAFVFSVSPQGAAYWYKIYGKLTICNK